MAWFVALLFYATMLPWNMAGAEYFNTRHHNATSDNGVLSGFDNGTFNNVVRAPVIGSSSYTDNGYLNYLLANYVFDNQIVNARDPRYGVVCDNVTDDSAAINAAIVAAGRKPVLLPLGDCRSIAPIKLKSGTRLSGSNRPNSNGVTGGTRIVHDSATLDNVFTVDDPTSGSYTYDIEVSNLGVVGNANTNAIFNLNKVAASHFHSMTLLYGAYGFWINFGMENTFDRIQSTNHTAAGVVIGTTNATTTQTFRKMLWQSIPWAMDIQKSASHIVVSDSVLESLTTGGINVYWTYSGSGLLLDKIHVENTPDNVIRFGVDGDHSGATGELILRDSFITEDDLTGNAIRFDGALFIQLSGNHIAGYDNVLFSDNEANLTELSMNGNNIVSNTNVMNMTTDYPATGISKIYGFYYDSAIGGPTLRTRKASIGTHGTPINKFNWGVAVSVADNTTIDTLMYDSSPTAAFCTATVATETCQVTNISGRNITIRLTKHDGTAGTSQTIYWIGMK
jgi:hypothetical protein